MSTKNREKKKKKKKKKDDFDFPRKTVGWHVLNSFRLGFIPRNPVVLVSLCKEGVKARGDLSIWRDIMDDDGKAPKSNADFRAYLRSKEDEKAKTTTEEDGRVCDDGGQNRRWQRRTTNHRRKKREREEEEDDGVVVPKYRDRARERRETMEENVEDAEEKGREDNERTRIRDERGVRKQGRPRNEQRCAHIGHRKE